MKIDVYRIFSSYYRYFTCCRLLLIYKIINNSQRSFKWPRTFDNWDVPTITSLPMF